MARKWFEAAGIAVGVLAAGAVTACAAAGRPQATVVATPGPLVTVAQGAVRGRRSGGVDAFLGIPYAAPPVGRLRWRAPRPAASFHGVRRATRLPRTCPQRASSGSPASTDEDCLDLSVYRPAKTSDRSRLPVLFWIHGGGLETGSGDQYDGSLIARINHVEVVSINYRLGVFGFLALPGLDRETRDHASGDFGLLDQEAALRWTRHNIAAFGGDPGDITIAGESAGGYSVCALLASPPVTGMFAHAIIESGSCTSTPLAAAERTGEGFARAVGCRRAATQIACLRGKSPQALLRHPLTASDILPTQGGSVLPVAPRTAITTGRFDRAPVLIGANRDEGRTFAYDTARDSEARYGQLLDTTFGAANGPKVLARYPWTSFPAPYRTAYALGAAETDSGTVDGIGGCATSALESAFSRWTQTYAYEFDDQAAPGLDRTIPGYRWGAAHATELAYLWPSFTTDVRLATRLTAAQHLLSAQMVRLWGQFTNAGDPNRPGEPSWPSYTTGQLLSLRPGRATTPIPTGIYAAEHQCGFWSGLGY